MTISEPQGRRKPLMSTGRRPLAEPYSQCFQNYYHASQCLQPTPQYIAGVRSSVNHWQLRDLVQIDPSLGTLYHTHDDCLRELTPLAQRLGTPLLAKYAQFPFFPRCFGHAQGGVVAAGSVITSSSKAYSAELDTLFEDVGARHRPQKGLFSVFTPEMAEPLTYKVGEMINNAVTLYARTGAGAAGYVAYVCNNDAHLYTVDVSGRGVLAERRVECEANAGLNNARLLLDGKRLAVAGDASVLYMVDAQLPRAVVERVKTGRGSGFGLLFHSNGVTMATACEDGACLLYDMRNMRTALHEIKLTRVGHQSGAFRSCKFLDLPVHDLLVVLEHAGRVHVVDLRHLDSDHQQVIVFPAALDQYAEHRRSGKGDAGAADAGGADMVSKRTVHPRLDIYDGEALFTAPLVYDYSYLTHHNPKLFKDFEFEHAAAPLHYSFGAAQLSINHTHGEMELSGLDWFENQLYIGCDDGGLLCWDVNVRARRSSGGFSVV